MKRGHYYVAITGILSGTIIFGGAVFSKLGLSMYEISVFRSMFALLLLPYLLFQKDFRLSNKMFEIYIGFGLIVALATLLEFAPVVLGVPVATSVLLIYTAPLWTVVFSKMFFKEEITTSKWMAIVLVLTGIVFLVNPMTISAGTSVVGLICALAGGVGLSLWGVYGKIAGNEDASPTKTQFYETFFALTFIALLYPILSIIIKNPALVSVSLSHPANIWFYMFIFSVFSYIIPHLFYFAGVKEIPASTAGVILLLEPLAGAILAAIFLGQAVTGGIVIGGLLILAGNYLVIRSEADAEITVEPGVY